MAHHGGSEIRGTTSLMETTMPIASWICGVLPPTRTLSSSMMEGAIIGRGRTIASPGSQGAVVLVEQSNAAVLVDGAGTGAPGSHNAWIAMAMVFPIRIALTTAAIRVLLAQFASAGLKLGLAVSAKPANVLAPDVGVLVVVSSSRISTTAMAMVSRTPTASTIEGATMDSAAPRGGAGRIMEEDQGGSAVPRPHAAFHLCASAQPWPCGARRTSTS